MINAMEVREDDDNFKNPVDLLFDALEEKDSDHFAVHAAANSYGHYQRTVDLSACRFPVHISCGAVCEKPTSVLDLSRVRSFKFLYADMAE